MEELQIAWRPLGELIPYARNPRTHSDAQVAQIAASIRQFSWTVPVLVDGENGIIAGHGRVLAARKLGLERVPVIELAHMTEAQRRAYVLADNQLALNARWDDALLRLELADLKDLGFDVGLIGFSEGELERLLAGDSKTGLTEDDEAPELPQHAVTRPGDLWVLGEHRLLGGDATVLADNKLALNAGWDEELLRLELADLSELGFDLGLIGFGEGELERLLAGGKEGLTEDDEAPALPEQAITQPGDLWVLGEHRLLCGDATVVADVACWMGGSPTWRSPIHLTM